MVVSYRASPSGTTGRYFLSGSITDDASTPICAMVLANGRKMFSCGTSLDQFQLEEVPVDGNGNITLFGFASGLQPYQVVFDPAVT